MSRKTLLIKLVTIILLVGAIFLAKPFLWALKPNVRAESALWQTDISGMQPGDFRYFQQDPGVQNGANILVLKDYEGLLRVYWVPTYKGAVILPDMHWWHWFGLCQDFGPDMENGKLKKDGLIHCKDNFVPNDQRGTMAWTYAGKSTLKYWDDMEVAFFKVDQGRLMLQWRPS